MKKAVAVIGGGVVGLSCALRLAQSGCHVVVLERGLIGREASWAGAGIIEHGSFARTDPLAQLRRRSVAAYGEFAAELRALSGVDPEFERCGVIDLIVDQNQRRAAERELAAAAEIAPPPLAQLDHAALAAAEPELAPEFEDALEIRVDSQVRNPRLMQALAAACRAVGVEIRENCGDVRPIVDRRTPTVQLADGATITADVIVLAAGAWSALLPDEFAAMLKVHPVRGQIALLKTPTRIFRRVLRLGRLYLAARRDGHVLVGSTEEHDSGFEKANTMKAVEWLLTSAVRVVPRLREAELMQCWAGLRPGSHDGKPFLGPLPGLPGFVAATGHFRSGLTMAPITAQLVTEYIVDGAPSFDWTPFVPGRAAERAEVAAPSSDAR